MNRQAEFDKYTGVYSRMENYRMSAQRHTDAMVDIQHAYDAGCRTYLDIGCGRGEMLKHAKACGFELVHGTEVVKELCNDRVSNLAIHELGSIKSDSYDCISCFDVIEHVIPDDDILLISEMGRMATKYVILTANNLPSVDAATGNNLHINIRPYDEWDSMIRQYIGPKWDVILRSDAGYVSETWNATQ